MPTSFASRLTTGVLAVSLLAAPVVAQVDENAPVDESGEVIEELVVVGTRPGDRATGTKLTRYAKNFGGSRCSNQSSSCGSRKKKTGGT